MEWRDLDHNDVADKVAEIIKRELERGRIAVDRKIIEEQDEAIREKLEKFNEFIYMVKELGEKPPKSSQTELYQKYHQKVDELTIMWKYELLEFLPRFTERELRSFIERDIRGDRSIDRCVDVAVILASEQYPVGFNYIAERVKWCKSFASLKSSSINKTLTRTLRDLKRMGLVIQAGKYFRLFNLDKEKGNRESDSLDIARILERYLVRIFKEILAIKEEIERIKRTMELYRRMWKTF